MTSPLAQTGTILTLHAGMNSLLPFYSARGIKQTMQLRDGAKSQRITVNGELVDLSLQRMHKYRTRISARDVRPPALSGVMPGTIVVVGCAYLDSYPTSGGSASRPVKSGSSFEDGHGFTFYEPVLTCMVDDLSNDFEEWQAGNEWFILLNEI